MSRTYAPSETRMRLIRDEPAHAADLARLGGAVGRSRLLVDMHGDGFSRPNELWAAPRALGDNSPDLPP